MFQNLPQQKPDPLLSLIKLYNDDPREGKIDLGVGVYKNADGNTPVFEAVKAAEKDLLEQQETKAYLGPEGDLGFVSAIMGLCLGNTEQQRDTAGLQTPGGTGALRLAFELVSHANPGATIWLGTPSWPIHQSILNALGLKVKTYPHIDQQTGGFNIQGALECATRASRGDVVLLHGCCHNPTGIDLKADHWKALNEIMTDKGLLPVIDIAYHGLGESIDKDAQGLRAFAANTPEALIAYSCDKNFGLYRERTGALLGIAQSPADADTLKSNLAAIARVNWSMPPDHGAAVVRTILGSSRFKEIWLGELSTMAERLRHLRLILAKTGAIRLIGLNQIAEQNGMFATLPISPDQVLRLRQDHGVYMAASGRINIAGLLETDVDHFTQALKVCA